MHLRFAVICLTASAVLPILNAAVDSSDKSEPAQLAPANLVAHGPNAGILRSSQSAEVKVDSRWITAWRASCVFHGAGSAFDAYTSYQRGPYETNPLLRDANGQFGNNAVMIKAGSFAAITALQWAVVRKLPKAAKFFIPVNAVLGGTYFYLGHHNQQFLKTQ